MEAGDAGDRFQPGRKIARHAREDALAPTRIDRVAATDMLEQAALGDELGQRPLGQGGGVQVGQLLGADHRFEDRRRQDHVAQAQFRQQGFRKGAHVSDDPVFIHALQGIGWPALVAEFAVVVVFDDDCAQLASPLQQGQPTCLAHGDAEWELVRRRHVDQPGAIGDPVDLNALRVNRHADHRRPVAAEQQARRWVTRVLHGNEAAGASQHPGDQVQRLLGTVAHHHIFILAIHATRERDVPGDGVTQRRQTFGQAIEALGARYLAQGVGRAAPPVVLGKLALAGGATNEVIAQRAFQGWVAQEYRQVTPGLDDLGTGQLGMALPGLCLGRPGVDVGAFADHAGQVVFVGQLRVRV
ncbi:hypothetical protein D3C73_955770 [compost metagenome]